MPSLQQGWRAAFWGALMLATWGALRPTSGADWFPEQDKAQHLATYACLYLAGRPAFPEAGWRLPAALLAYGVGIELVQSLTPTRTMSFADVVADACGIALGVPLLGAAQRRWPKLWRVERRSGSGWR